MIRKYGLSVSVLLLFLFLNNAFASPWLQKKKTLQVINNVSGTYQNCWIDNCNNVIGKDSHLYGLNYQLYGEYGITDKNTIGLNSIFSFYAAGPEQHFLESFKDVNHNTGYGMLFTEIFYRRGLIQTKHFVWSLESTFKTPSLYQNNYVGHGVFVHQNQMDLEFKMNFGFNFFDDGATYGLFGMSGDSGLFFGGSIAYRHRFDLTFSELRFELLFGFHLNKHFSFIAQFFKIVSLNNIYHHEELFVSSYHFGKFILNFVANLNSNLSIVTGLLIDVAPSQNDVPLFYGPAMGSGVIIGVWSRF